MSQAIQVFDSFGVMIRYLTEELSAFSEPIMHVKLEAALKFISSLQDKVQAQNHQINSLVDENEKLEQQLHTDTSELRELIESERNRLEEEKVTLNQLHDDEKEKLVKTIETLKAKFNEEKDKHAKCLKDRINTLECEVSSLNCVLELKDAKIKSQNRQLMECEQSLEELTTLKSTVTVLRQKVEQMHISLENKNQQIKRLMSENESLKFIKDDSVREKNRLSLKNEQLQFVLSRSATSGDLSFASAFDPCDLKVRCSSSNDNKDSTAGNESPSLNACSPASLPADESSVRSDSSCSNSDTPVRNSETFGRGRLRKARVSLCKNVFTFSPPIDKHKQSESPAKSVHRLAQGDHDDLPEALIASCAYKPEELDASTAL